jgi:putative ABC transport system permease protein
MSMTKTAILAEAWISMGATKMRSFLTMLGIIIGVGAVVLMLAIGQGVQDKIQSSINSMGNNLFIVLSGSTTSGGIRQSTGSAPTLKGADARDIATLDGVLKTAPAMPGSAQVVAGASNWSTGVTGVTPDYLSVREWRLRIGVNFTEADQRSAARVALLGQRVATSLFADPDEALGQTIRIKNLPFTVTGILESKGQSLDGRDQDDVVLIPLSTAQRKLFGGQFPDSVRFIMVKATAEEVMERVEGEMQKLLRARHRLAPNAEDDFTIRNLTAVAQTAAVTGQTLSLLLGAIASISLIVGGIGIMNIMLVSVTERTREIGIRKAIGAFERDILLQFLLEAIIISLTGGALGVVLGVGGTLIANIFLPFQAVVSPFSIALSFLVAASVGIFFGYYPARKAARLKPIEALRYG